MTGLHVRLGLVLAAGCASACISETSYVVVRALSPAGQPIVGVTQLVAFVHNGALADTLTYPETAAAPFTLTPNGAVTFSVSFSSGRTGVLEIGVAALDVQKRILGYGTGMPTIRIGKTATVDVTLIPGTLPPGSDGGSGDAGSDGGFLCALESASGCAQGSTCALVCHASGAIESHCAAAGTGKPGATCAADTDCEPGSQCFVETCGVKLCRRYCTTATECGVGSACSTEITCDGASIGTGHRICAQPCDPRGDAQSGCVVGLHCFVFGNEEVDCDCGGPGRKGKDGEACVSSGDCAPGFLCVSTGPNFACRPLCRLDSPADCVAPSTCQQLVNPTFTTFGACLRP